MEDESLLFTNILLQLSDEAISLFFHACIDEICGSKAVTFQQVNNSVERSEDVFETAHNYAITLFSDPALLYLQDDKMPKQYTALSTEIQRSVRKCVTVRREQLVRALTINQLVKTDPTLVDFDWRLKWVMGSSKLATLKEPLLQLDLLLKDRKGERHLDVEINKDELDMLINELETKVSNS